MSRNVRTSSITIAASPETIFAIIANPYRHHQFDGSNSIEGVVDGPKHLSLGDHFEVRMHTAQVLRYKAKNTVVEYEKNRLIAWKNQGPQIWRYEIAPQADGTSTVTETCDYGPWGPFAGIARWLGRTDQHSIEASLPRLKTLAEADQS